MIITLAAEKRDMDVRVSLELFISEYITRNECAIMMVLRTDSANIHL
jgi:hypothetical protein